MINKQHTTDKHSFTRELFDKLLGDSFLFAHGNAAWKEKRKVSTHAFFKDKVQMMSETFKQVSAAKVAELK